MIPTNEFSRRLNVEPWPGQAIAVDVSADPAECEALAERFGLLAVHSLRGRGRVEQGREPGELVLRASLEAEVVQECVVTLEPVPARLFQEVERRYRTGATAGASWSRYEPHGVEVLDEDDDEIEPVIGGAIDLGEVFAEELGLALDPYPRAAGAALDVDAIAPHVSVGSERGGSTPFAVLRQLQEKHAR